MGCILSFFKFNNNKSYKVAETGGEDKSSHHGKKSSKKQHQHQQQHHQQQQQQQQHQHQPQLQEKPLHQQSGHDLQKSLTKNVLPLSNQSFIYKTVLEATVSDAKANEEEERIKAAEAPGPFEIETDLLSPEVEEAVIKIQANVRGYLTRKLYRGVTPEPDRSVGTSQQPVTPSATPSQEPSNEQPKSSSGILAPPPSFSDTPKELPLDNDDTETAANQGKKIAEKLIELERQVSQQAINEPPESKVDDVIASHKDEDNSNYGIGKDNFKQSPVDCIGSELKRQSENNDKEQNRAEDGFSLSQSQLGIPSIETSEAKGSEEAAIKIQAAFRGYQVRKTISRETSPCQTREGGTDRGQDVVHLREKDGTSSTQDPERESILVLNQLEECLSQELMRSSINLEDETSLSSYSTDVDLNASLKSNVSLMASTMMSTHADDDNTDLKFASIGSGDSSSTVNNQLEQSSIGNEQSIKIPDTIESVESVNNEQIVGTSQSDSSVISIVNQVPLDIQINKHPVDDCLDSSLTSSNPKDQIEMIQAEPVLLVPIGEKVDAIDGSLKDDQPTDPVLIVQLNGKVDASQVTSSDDQSVKEVVESIETIETQPQSLQFNADTKLQVDAIDSTESVNEPSSSSTDSHQTSLKMEEPKAEPSSSDKPHSPGQSTSNEATDHQIVTKDNPVEQPQTPQQITSSIPNVHFSPPVTSDKQGDLNTDDRKSIDTIDAPAKESEQKVTKLMKEDSFGSDILILDDEKNDSLYDPFVDDLTTPTMTPNVQQSSVDVGQLTTSTTFVEDNLIKSVVDDINKDEGLVLYEANSKSTIDSETVKRLPDDNITEVKDDILVNLDESDEEEDEDSQRRPIEEPKSPIVINIHRPSDAQEVEQIIKEKSKDIDEGFSQSEEPSTKQLKSQNERTINEWGDTPVVATSTQNFEETVQGTVDSGSEMRSENQSNELIDDLQQSTTNNDTALHVSTNPFLDQPDFDSDIESGKIVLTDRSSTNLKDDQEKVQVKESESKQEEMEVQESETKADVDLPANEETIQTTGAKDPETFISEVDESKDSESSMKQMDNEGHSLAIASSTQPKVDEQLNPFESSTSPSSSSVVNQPPVVIESIDGGSDLPTNEPTNCDPDEDEAAPPPDSLLLRLQERETRSRSPNPFGRKKRRQKKNRGGAN